MDYFPTNNFHTINIHKIIILKFLLALKASYLLNFPYNMLDYYILGGNPRLARSDGLKEIITLKLYRLIYWGILIIFYGNTSKRVSKDLYKFIMNLR